MANVTTAESKEDSGIDATDLIIGVGAADTAWRFKKQTAWLLRNTWRVGTSLAKKHKLAAIVLAGFSLLQTDAAKEALAEIEKSVGKQYRKAEEWVSDLMMDDNILALSADAVNTRVDAPEGIFDGIPMDIVRAIPEPVRQGLADRKERSTGLVTIKQTRPVSALEMRIHTMRTIGTYFGVRDASSMKKLRYAIKDFVTMSELDLDEVTHLMEV
jgi:hypothetical protein